MKEWKSAGQTTCVSCPRTTPVSCAAACFQPGPGPFHRVRASPFDMPRSRMCENFCVSLCNVRIIKGAAQPVSELTGTKHLKRDRRRWELTTVIFHAPTALSKHSRYSQRIVNSRSIAVRTKFRRRVFCRLRGISAISFWFTGFRLSWQGQYARLRAWARHEKGYLRSMSTV